MCCMIDDNWVRGSSVELLNNYIWTLTAVNLRSNKRADGRDIIFFKFPVS